MATLRETHMPFDGVIRDVSNARNVAEVIDLVPEFGAEVSTIPVYAANGTTMERYKTPVVDGVPLGGSQGAIIGADFGLTQRRTNLEALQKLVDHGAQWRSVGLTKYGLRMIAEVALPEATFGITRHNGRVDEIEPRCTILDALNMELSRTSALMMFQIWCMNQWPSLVHSGNLMKQRHSRLIGDRLDKAQTFLAERVQEVQQERSIIQRLEDTPLDSKAFVTFVSQLLTGEDDSQKALKAVNDMEAGSAKTILLRKVDTIATLFHHGTGNCGRTAFDALSAVTEWRTKGGSVNEDAELLARVKARQLGDSIGHEVSDAIATSQVVLTDSERRRTERRLQSNLDGTSAKLVQRAARLLTSTTAIAA